MNRFIPNKQIFGLSILISISLISWVISKDFYKEGILNQLYSDEDIASQLNNNNPDYPPNKFSGDYSIELGSSPYIYDSEQRKIFFVEELAGRTTIIKKEVINADPLSFKVLVGYSGGLLAHAKDKHGIYCNEKLRPDMDRDTFRLINDEGVREVGYAADKATVYYKCEEIIGADPVSFEVYPYDHTSHFAKDKYRVYVNGKPIPNADPSSIDILAGGPGYSFDKSSLYKGLETVGRSNSYHFNSYSTGKIVWYDHYLDGSLRLGTGRVAIFEENGKANVVSQLRTSDRDSARRITVYQGKVYFFNTSGILQSFDISNNTFNTFNFKGLEVLDTDGDPRINDFFITQNKIFILYGKNCNSYLEKCSVDLLVHDIPTNTTSQLVSNIEFREIIGFDENTNDIYVAYWDGDAGCIFSRTLKINLVSRFTKEFSFAGCSGEDWLEEEDTFEAEYKAYKNNFLAVENDVQWGAAIHIQNGKIIPPLKEGGAVRYIYNK